MMKKTHGGQIPAPIVVRCVAVVLLLFSVALLGVCLFNVSSLGGWGVAIIVVGALASITASIFALVTGDPAWIFLDLITPW